MFHTKVDYELFHLGSLVDHFLQKLVVINYPVNEAEQDTFQPKKWRNFGPDLNGEGVVKNQKSPKFQLGIGQNKWGVGGGYFHFGPSPKFCRFLVWKASPSIT